MSSNSDLKHQTGEDEGQEQAGASTAGHHQGVCDEGGWENQGGDPGVESDQHKALGCFTQKLHPGESNIASQNIPLTARAAAQCSSNLWEKNPISNHPYNAPSGPSSPPSCCVMIDNPMISCDMVCVQLLLQGQMLFYILTGSDSHVSSDVLKS